jgi:hypothetical protein
MMHLFASVLLVFTPIIEKIALTDELEIEARYMEAGEALTDEGMLMSIEDFGLIQGHYLTLEPAWRKRIEALHAEHERNILRIQDEHRQQIEYTQQLNQMLEKGLEAMELAYEREQERATMYKWVTVGVSVLAGGAIIYALGK